MSAINNMADATSPDFKGEGQTLNDGSAESVYKNQEESGIKLSKDQLLSKLFEDMDRIQVILDKDDHDSMDEAYAVYKNIIGAIDFNDHVNLSKETQDSIDVLGDVFVKDEKQKQKKAALQKEKQNKLREHREAFEKKVEDDAEDAVELMIKMKFGEIEKGKFLYKDVFKVLEQYDMLREFVEENELDEPRFREKLFDYLVRISLGQPIGWWDMIDQVVEKLEE